MNAAKIAGVCLIWYVEITEITSLGSKSEDKKFPSLMLGV
jgi:hypothetical protein